ncbi:hypothetical protein K239x_54090 [Planctomycetes bacterium K23_9]|uniref:Uncharacterized protein n=1 Tax=Stieleria marina TaxID=1930275 RepID=A0A517P1Z4_9BACT|nr:hypothetical protein K239x_54090 [Planctomycetes bacterium K23_9]
MGGDELIAAFPSLVEPLTVGRAGTREQSHSEDRNVRELSENSWYSSENIVKSGLLATEYFVTPSSTSAFTTTSYGAFFA